MKRVFLVVSFFFISIVVFTQAASVSWSMVNNNTWTATGNAQGGTIGITGITATWNQTCGPCSSALVTSAWDGSVSDTKCGYSYTEYVEFPISPTSGYSITVTNFSFTGASRWSNCNTNSTLTRNYRIRYSKDGFNTTIGCINSCSPITTWSLNQDDCEAKNHTIPGGGISVLSGETLRIRIYWESCDVSRKFVIGAVTISGVNPLAVL